MEMNTDPTKPFSKSSEFWVGVVLLALVNITGALGTIFPQSELVQAISVISVALANTASAVGFVVVRQGTKKEMMNSLNQQEHISSAWLYDDDDDDDDDGGLKDPFVPPLPPEGNSDDSPGKSPSSKQFWGIDLKEQTHEKVGFSK